MFDVFRHGGGGYVLGMLWGCVGAFALTYNKHNTNTHFKNVNQKTKISNLKQNKNRTGEQAELAPLLDPPCSAWERQRAGLVEKRAIDQDSGRAELCRFERQNTSAAA